MRSLPTGRWVCGWRGAAGVRRYMSLHTDDPYGAKGWRDPPSESIRVRALPPRITWLGPAARCARSASVGAAPPAATLRAGRSRAAASAAGAAIQLVVGRGEACLRCSDSPGQPGRSGRQRPTHASAPLPAGGGVKPRLRRTPAPRADVAVPPAQGVAGAAGVAGGDTLRDCHHWLQTSVARRTLRVPLLSQHDAYNSR
eukprot:scaffold619_cov403-Prasinococcus_capsulatus_cf.AAC.12